MARTVDAEARERRRSEFLDAAHRLIETRGYDRMSIRDVLDATGASRGAFYHYFPAKQELVSAVIDRFAASITTSLELLAADTTRTRLDRLRRIFGALSARDSRERDTTRATLAAWYYEGNIYVHQRFRSAIIERLTDLLATRCPS